MRFSKYIIKEEAEVQIVTEREVLRGIKGGRFTVDGYNTEVDSIFHCDEMFLTKLDGCPGIVKGDFIASRNRITSLEGVGEFIKQIDGTLDLQMNPIKSNVLGLLKIKGLKRVEFDASLSAVSEIINKYLPNTIGAKAVMQAQSELLDANLDEFAQL